MEWDLVNAFRREDDFTLSGIVGPCRGLRLRWHRSNQRCFRWEYAVGTRKTIMFKWSGKLSEKTYVEEPCIAQYPPFFQPVGT